MQANPLLHHILDDDALMRQLGDAERAYSSNGSSNKPNASPKAAKPATPNAKCAACCRRARAIGRFVYLWSLQRLRRRRTTGRRRTLLLAAARRRPRRL